MNIKELKDYLNCDDAFLVSLMQKFIEEVTEITITIQVATAAKKWEIVKLNAHKMLSSVRIFEMKNIIVLLEKLEIEAGGNKNSHVIEEDVKKLSTLVEEVIHDVKTSLEEIKIPK